MVHEIKYVIIQTFSALCLKLDYDVMIAYLSLALLAYDNPRKTSSIYIIFKHYLTFSFLLLTSFFLFAFEAFFRS